MRIKFIVIVIDKCNYTVRNHIDEKARKLEENRWGACPQNILLFKDGEMG